ncbi:MAG: class I SAM-dependent methyltransferase [Pseudomonadota bacterium]
MNRLKNIAKFFAKKGRYIFLSVLFSYPKKVQCNICGWQGRCFASDSWHSHINCPKCRSEIRHRLFFAALQYVEEVSLSRLIHKKSVLHFAPEDVVSSNIRSESMRYVTSDFLRQDCDLKLNMSEMPEVKSGSFDVVIAFDVLEHVPDYKKALEEIYRVLSPKGWAIFTVPQKDNLLTTYEDPAITEPDDRIRHFGQYDHLRLFGDDFANNVGEKGFSVTVVNETSFSEDLVKKHVLFPPILSSHPLATNYRKVFFCQKIT